MSIMDMERARKILLDEGCTCVLCRGENVCKSHLRGVKPLLELLDRSVDVGGFSAADKVVGRATAFLYCLLGVKRVYGCVMSASAVEVLQAAGVEATWDTLVDGIRNRNNDGPCPMEAATVGISDPEEALRAIRDTLARLQG